jgi:hypothetical protein
VSSDVVRGDLISEALGTLPGDGNVMQKHEGAAIIINKLNE